MLALAEPNFIPHDAMQVSGLLEGDIVPQVTSFKNRRQVHFIELVVWRIFKNFCFEKARAIVKKNSKLWRKGLVPYAISSTFSEFKFSSVCSRVTKLSIFTDKQSRAVIARAMMEFERVTCLRFVPRTTERDFVVIIGNGDGWGFLILFSVTILRTYLQNRKYEILEDI